MQIRKKPIGLIAAVLAVLLVSSFILWVIGLGVLPRQSYIKSQMYDFYHSENIDTIFVGPSFMYRSINPEIVDNLCGTNSFNLGTSAQKPIDSYYMIKEAIRVQPIKCIVLDVTQGFYCGSSYTAQNKSSYLIYDRMENSSVKNEYFYNAFNADTWVFALFKACHYDFPSWNDFLKNIKSAFENEIEPEPIIWDSEWYAGRGFINSLQIYERDAEITPAEAVLNDETVEWLRKIILLCEENGIKLITVASPKTNDNISETINYEENYNSLSKVIEEYGLNYYDFSLMDTHELFTDDCFVDYAHLNGKGAEIYSRMVANLILGLPLNVVR